MTGQNGEFIEQINVRTTKLAGDVLPDLDNSLPKYSQLKEFLKRRMQQKEILCEQLLPSEHVLARQFKMSRHTVRQALGELENEGWIRREQGRGTFCTYKEKVNRGTIAVITTYISDYIFPTIIRGIDEVFSSSGYTLALANTSNDKVKEAQCLANFLNRDDIAGFIVEPTKSAKENTNAPYFKELSRRGIPYIFLHAYYPDLDPAYIIMDDQQGSYTATKYLLQLGHRDIAGIFKADDIQGIKREAGFKTALAEDGVAFKPALLGRYETEQLLFYPYQFVKSTLHKLPRPTAIVCYNDQIALKVMEAIRDEGLRVPDDISVTGYDDSSLALAPEVKLTTIKHPKAEMGREAARLIIDMVEKRVERPRFTYQPELIIRNSCRNL
ncbi:MAG: GntR family transcriptional regulator [Bacillota bacterium]